MAHNVAARLWQEQCLLLSGRSHRYDLTSEIVYIGIARVRAHDLYLFALYGNQA